jgi:ligand-binding SRPBCC domain-containing protein
MHTVRHATQRLAALVLSASDTAPRDLTLLHRETVVPAPLDDTFAFFADALNLERLTPPWLNFTILTPMPVAMQRGLVIDYRIRLYGVSIPWRSRIDVWKPGVGFVDRQIVGPYRWWRHEHRFQAVEGGTRVIDRVEYVPRARWFSRGLVQRDVERIFAYREEALRAVFHSTRSGKKRHAARVA